jgi:hypothetical protein
MIEEAELRGGLEIRSRPSAAERQVTLVPGRGFRSYAE